MLTERRLQYAVIAVVVVALCVVAVVVVTDLFRTPPAGHDAWIRGNAALETGDLAAAKTAFTSAITAAPEHIGARFGLATVLLLQNRAAEAVDAFETLISKMAKTETASTDTAVVYALLGVAHDQAGQFPAAVDAYQRSLDQNFEAVAKVPLFTRFAKNAATLTVPKRLQYLKSELAKPVDMRHIQPLGQTQ